MRIVNSLMMTFLAAAALLISASAQTPVGDKRPETPKRISGGVLNGKATRLPKPVYPPEAKAVGASGPVTVQVVIDEKGYVATATAVSGHPLLRDAAVEAASSATFAPTYLDGQPVKVSGVITYNFVSDLSPVSLGYELAYAETTGAFGENVYPDSLASQLRADWVAERRLLSSMGKPVTLKPVENEPPKAAADYTQRKLSSDDEASIRKLQSDIDARLRSDPGREWAFKVGRLLGRMVAEIDQDYKFRANTAELEQLVAQAPPTASDIQLKQLKVFLEKCKATGSSPEDRKAIAAEARMFRTMQL